MNGAHTHTYQFRVPFDQIYGVIRYVSHHFLRHLLLSLTQSLAPAIYLTVVWSPFFAAVWSVSFSISIDKIELISSAYLNVGNHSA